MEWADRIFAMSPAHLDEIARLGGGEKAVLLGSFAVGAGEGERALGFGPVAVPDPFGGDDEVLRKDLADLGEVRGIGIETTSGRTGIMMSDVTARTRVLALIGDPVAHSSSPTIQNAAMRDLGLDGVYVASSGHPG